MTDVLMPMELVKFPKPDGIDRHFDRVPDAVNLLFIEGIPKRFIGRRFWADSSVTLLDLEDTKWAVRFGSSGLGNAVVVRLDDGVVIERFNVPGDHTLFVNSSIRQLVKTVVAVASRFPYYDADSNEDEIKSAAREVLDIVRNIDPEAAIPDRYWSTFVDDMEIGDLSTNAILSLEKQ